MAWVFLIIAGLCETGWVILLKFSHGQQKWWPTLLAFGISLVSFFLMERALKELPPGTSYAVWTGIGAVGATIVGIVAFKEPFNVVRVACIALVVIGIVGLRATMNEAVPLK